MILGISDDNTLFVILSLSWWNYKEAINFNNLLEIHKRVQRFTNAQKSVYICLWIPIYLF